MKVLSRLLIIVLGLLVFSAYSSNAGLIMQRERYEEGSGNKSNSIIYIQSNKVKSTDEDGQFTIIFDLETGNIIQIDNISRTYSSTPSEDYFSYYSTYASKMKAAMQQQLSELAPDERARAEARMKQQGIDIPGPDSGSVEITLKKTDNRKKIAGYQSYKFEIYRNGKLDEEIWTSDDPRLREELDMKKLSNYLAELKKVTDGLGGKLLLNNQSEGAYTEVYSSGFPMKTAEYPISGKTIIENTVKVSKKDIDSSEFNPPTTYRKVTLDQMLQLGVQ